MTFIKSRVWTRASRNLNEGPDPVSTYFVSYKDKPMCYDYSYDDSEIVMDTGLVFWERYKRHGGFRATINSGAFKDFEQVRFKFPPMEFNTHELDGYPGWKLIIKQRSRQSRVKLALMNASGFGVRFWVKGAVYPSLEDVLIQVNQEYVIDKNNDLASPFRTEHVQYRDRVRIVDRIVPAQLDLVEFLNQKNDETLRSLGDWRPGKPDLTHVINLNDYVERVQNAEPDQGELFDVREAIERIA